jgi:F-type H+-transporting ATPase subunit b
MTSGDGALDALLEVERRVEQEIAAARVEAERRVEAAREDARRLESDAAEPLHPERAALRTRIDAEAAAAIRQLERDARAEAESYRSVEQTTLRRLGARVVANILALDAT